MKVLYIFFSRKTYQVEILDGEKNHWVFIQLTNSGDIIDQFCDCQREGADGQCIHIQKALDAIFQGHSLPLHVRFHFSFWRSLLQVFFDRFPDPFCFMEKTRGLYELYDDEKNFIFSLYAKCSNAQKLSQEFFQKRDKETEETSLKFSTLSSEELSLYRQGKPSYSLRFELSIWGDVAKWIFILENQDRLFHVQFDDNARLLPKYIYVQSSQISACFQIRRDDWPSLIPLLIQCSKTLQVFDCSNKKIKSIQFFPKKKCFIVCSDPLFSLPFIKPDAEWDKWAFYQTVGFVPKGKNFCYGSSVISEPLIEEFLDRWGYLVQKFCKNASIFLSPREVSHQLFFDKKRFLHICMYISRPGDLQDKNSQLFGLWAYVASQKSFFQIKNYLSRQIETIISKSSVALFVQQHQQWLNQFTDFAVHVLTHINIPVIYHMTKESLILEQKRYDKEMNNGIYFENLLYVPGKGFYLCKPFMAHLFGRSSCLCIKRCAISSFLQEHCEDLHQVKQFFCSDVTIKDVKISMSIKKKEGEYFVIIEPRFILDPWIDPQNIEIFGNFLYIPRGFVEIPLHLDASLLQFCQRRESSLTQMLPFLQCELSTLLARAVHIDRELRIVDHVVLVIYEVRKRGRGWLARCFYRSDYGEVSIWKIFYALYSGESFLPSEAGLFLFQKGRFSWLRRISKNAFSSTSDLLFLSTVEWIRLSLFEKIVFETSSEEAQCLLHVLTNDYVLQPLNIRGFSRLLRPYQKVGVSWLWYLYKYGLSGFLCDEMGLGKSYQAIGLLLAVSRAQKGGMIFLIVCPTSVIYHWEDLLRKFFTKVHVVLYHGSQRFFSSLLCKKICVLTTYGVLRSEKELFFSQKFEISIFDEIQIAKNTSSQIHVVLKNIQSAMKIGLTGTPIENNLLELKSLFDIIVPGLFPSHKSFRENFVVPIQKNGEKEQEKLLSQMIRPFILRRHKADVLKDLPEKIEKHLYVDLSAEQRVLYRKIVFSFKNIPSEKNADFYSNIFYFFHQLKQVCDHPSLIYKDVKHFEKHKSGKWEVFLEVLSEALKSNQKLVVFSQYLRMLDIIELYLCGQQIEYGSVRGSTKDRRKEIERFQLDPQCKVFVASMASVGLGINLQAASVVVHYDRSWNASKESQATDRVHRIGQNKGVHVFTLITKNTIEEYIHQIIERKKYLMRSILGFGFEGTKQWLSKQDLLDLLKKISSNLEQFS